MRRRSLAVFVTALTIHPWCALTAQSTVMEKDFGAVGEVGFKVVFDQQGASVRSIRLLDHRVSTAEDSPLYPLVVDEFVQPANPARGFVPWLWLEEEQPPGSPSQFALEQGTVGLSKWAVEEEDRAVTFTLEGGNGLRLTKRFSHEPGRRDLLLEITLHNDRGEAVAGAEVPLYLQGVGVRSPVSEYVFGTNPAYAVASRLDPATGEAQVESVAPAPTDPPPQLLPPGTKLLFAGSTNRFFGAFMYPDDESSRDAVYAVTAKPRPATPHQDLAAFSMPVVRTSMKLAVPQANQQTTVGFRLYLGPKSNRVFSRHPAYEQFAAVVTEDLGRTQGCFCNIPGVQTMARFLVWMMGIFYGLVGNWGVAIMILTFVVRGALVPLNFRMQKSMRAYGAKMQKLKPQLDAIQKQYADDRAALQRKMVEFQREHKIFPPIGGCLPMFMTIPVFLGLFTAIRVSYDLRQQPFFGWIDDLSQPDQLFVIGLDWLPYFNLLPLIMVGMWWWLQSSTPLPSDPQQRQVMRIMRFMPFMFGILLYNYGAGLMVYMCTSSIFGLIEQRVTRRILGPVNPEAAAFGGQPMM